MVAAAGSDERALLQKRVDSLGGAGVGSELGDECRILGCRNSGAAPRAVRGRLPFPRKGIGSDNGSEFLNVHLVPYCAQKQLTFIRCRPYHKDDHAHAEQKHWSVVRQVIDYERFEGGAACVQLNAIYAVLHVHVNGYLPRHEPGWQGTTGRKGSQAL